VTRHERALQIELGPVRESMVGPLVELARREQVHRSRALERQRIVVAVLTERVCVPGDGERSSARSPQCKA